MLLQKMLAYHISWSYRDRLGLRSCVGTTRLWWLVIEYRETLLRTYATAEFLRVGIWTCCTCRIYDRIALRLAIFVSGDTLCLHQAYSHHTIEDRKTLRVPPLTESCHHRGCLCIAQARFASLIGGNLGSVQNLGCFFYRRSVEL